MPKKKKNTNKKPEYEDNDSDDMDLDLSSDDGSGSGSDAKGVDNYDEDFDEDTFDEEYDEGEVDSPDEDASDNEMGMGDNDPSANADNSDSDDDCVYKLTRSAVDREASSITYIPVDDDVKTLQENEKYVKSEDRISRPYLSKYEKTLIISDRTIQIKTGSMIFIKDKPGKNDLKTMNARQKAEMELALGKCPFIIERPLANGKIELWDANELTDLNKEEFIESLSKVIEIN